MRVGLLILVLSTITISILAADSPVFILFKRLREHETCEWRISEARALATPEWNIDSSDAPLAPDKAWKIAKDWFARQGKPRPEFVKIEIRPFVPESESTKLNEGLKKRFYYLIDCSPVHHIEGMNFDYMSVIVLMDATVLEPTIKSLESRKQVSP
jgi:hypothetical protein